MINISKNESKAIDMIRYLCVISIVIIHTNTSHLIPSELTNKVNHFETFFGSFYSNAALNLMFVLSGYLFFRKPINYTGYGYLKQLKSRIHSLLTPYIFWCIIGVTYSIIMNEINISNLSLQKVFWGTPETSWHPMGRVVWYVRDLIVFSIFSPLYYLAAKKLGVTIGLFIIIAIDYFKIISLGNDFPTFNIYIFLGSLLAVNGITFSDLINKNIWKLALPIYIIYAYFSSFYEIKIPYFAILSWIGLFSFCLNFKFSNNIISASSFIYFIHAYFSSLYRVCLTRLIDQSNFYICIITFILSVFLSILSCYICFYLMKRYTPRILEIITGGRI